MNSQNNSPIFKTGTNLYMNIKTPETVFITGRGMKQPAFLVSGLILIVLGLVLTGIFPRRVTALSFTERFYMG